MATSQPVSTRTSSSDLTILNSPAPHTASPEKSTKHTSAPTTTRQPLFSEPGTIPLPDSGFHHLGVVFEDLTVLGSGASQRTVEGLETSVLRMWDLPSFIARLLNIKMGPTRPLISNVSGVVPAGQTCLVLGRPGSGCSTLLRALSNTRDSFVKVLGDVHYGNLDAAQAKKLGLGDILFNSEEDNHNPLLKVEETLDLALSLKKPHIEPGRRSDFVTDQTTRLLGAFGMPHTRRTLVGNDYVRGVSGGERKRVSLAEVLSANAACVAWDNAIRGLDSAVAVHYLRVLKELSRSTGMTNIVSIYQASQDMYDECFDRVVVLYEGLCVFSGRTSDACAYFEEMGWERKARQTSPDFLTSCTSPTERRIRDDHVGKVPSTAPEMESYWKNSAYFQSLQAEIVEYKTEHAASSNTQDFLAAVAKSKQPGSGKTTGYKTNFALQVATLVKAQFRVQRADLRTFWVRVISNTLQAVLVGAIFFRPPPTANGAFSVIGALFFSILYFCIFAFGEVPSTVQSRPLLIKHRSLGFYHPAAFTISQMVLDVPLYAVQTLIFSALFYFLIGLNSGARYFFTFWFIVFSAYFSLSAMYRMIGSWSPNLSVAVRYGGLALAVVLSAAGFMLPSPQQHRWAHWMGRIGVPAWALEALLANEFRTRVLTCGPNELVPSGPGYADITYQACTIVGGQAGSASVSGADYLAIKYNFSASHIWRNVGIIWAFWAIYTILIVVGSSLLIRDVGGSSSKLFKRGAAVPKANKDDHLRAERTLSRRDGQGEKEEPALDLTNAPVFTFKDVRYTVQVDGKDKVLLDGVTALVQPGKLTALMGSSGAGKTTLLDTISGRKTVGKVEGEMLIDGKPLASDFSRRTGFVQQGDIHEPYSTVRECLQFSALLRQTGNKTREEKLAYAEEVIDLLELGPIADAIVGNPDIGGLGVEERKRLTIGTELAANPDFLLFLDEPTSGLDSQAAFEIVRFLRKVAARGISILCTIHQPSGDLFELFDSVVLLAPGGKTVFAGPLGEGASLITEYFGQLGAHCEPNANPAEFILSTVAPVGGSKIDWNAHWKASTQAKEMEDSIATICARNSTFKELTEDQKSPAFAASWRLQTDELIKRNFRAQWRDGSYYTTKLVTLVFFGLFVGFYNYKLPHSADGIQSLSLGILTLLQSSPPIALDIAINYQQKMAIYVARERNGIYSWTALVTSLIITETPILLLGYTLLFFCSFWTMGLQSTAQVGALSWLVWIVVAVFTSTNGILLGAVSPTPFAVPFVLSLIWNLFNCLSWLLIVHDNMPSPFRWFFSYLSPVRWLFGSLISNDLSSLAVTCSESEFTIFNVPVGETCGSYAASFLETASGYLANPEATTNCAYCTLKSGANYVQQLGYAYEHRWRDWGIFIVFVACNVLSIYGATWLTRIRPLYKN